MGGPFFKLSYGKVFKEWVLPFFFPLFISLERRINTDFLEANNCSITMYALLLRRLLLCCVSSRGEIMDRTVKHIHRPAKIQTSLFYTEIHYQSVRRKACLPPRLINPSLMRGGQARGIYRAGEGGERRGHRGN